MPHQTMELGYWIAEPFWGKGYVEEACRGVLAFAFAEYSPERMQARVIEGNDPSARVLEKLGFREEGTLRRSLLREESSRTCGCSRSYVRSGRMARRG